MDNPPNQQPAEAREAAKASRRKGLEGMTAPELNQLMKAGSIKIAAGMTNAAKVEAIIANEFPDVQEGAQNASSPPQAPQQPPPPPEAASPPPVEPEDPLIVRTRELDQRLAALYEKLITLVKQSAAEGVGAEESKILHAGAVEFLKQCNLTLADANATNADTKKAIVVLNAQKQSVAKSLDELERRSAEYKAEAARIDALKAQVLRARQELEGTAPRR